MNLVRLVSGWWVNPTTKWMLGLLRRWGWLALCVGIAAMTWQYGPSLWGLLHDRQALAAFVEELGWFGPGALILFNALQIVIAPVPGYVVQAAAGYLFGPLWGGLWSALGMLAGTTLAMWLARTYGRRFVEQWLGVQRVTRWEAATHSSDTWLWFLLLLAPTGDLPYFLAGLARIGYTRIALLTLVIRIPTVFVVAGVGAGAVILPWWQVAAIIALFGALLAFGLYNQERLSHWVERQVQQRIS